MMRYGSLGNLYPETTIDIRESMEKLGEQRVEFAYNYRKFDLQNLNPLS